VPHADPIPAPPYADGTGLPWDVSVPDAVAAIAAARARHGDTFAVHSGQDRYLFTFSPAGVESFYGLPEEKASKRVADYLMLRRKLPDEIFDGRRILPGTLFRRDDVAAKPPQSGAQESLKARGRRLRPPHHLNGLEGPWSNRWRQPSRSSP
jgi:hypothetical protein